MRLDFLVARLDPCPAHRFERLLDRAFVVAAGLAEVQVGGANRGLRPQLTRDVVRHQLDKRLAAPRE